MIAELLLVRHGETAWNAEGRFQGCSDVPLNATGRQQAERIAEELARRRLDAIYSSALSRSLDTARLIAGRLGLQLRVEPCLNEIDQGEWEGMLATDIAERYPELYRRWSEDPRSAQPPRGESIRSVHDRVIAAIERIVATHPGGTLCLVTHKTVMVVIRCHYCGLDIRQEMRGMPQNASWESITIERSSPGSWEPGSRCCSVVA